MELLIWQTKKKLIFPAAKVYNLFIKYSSHQHLGSYFAGLFEGDGHISMPTNKHKHNPRFHITFHIKDLPLAQKLLSKVGFGFVQHKPKQNACVLIVSEIKGWKRILELINGQLRTPKIHSLHLVIDWLNQHHNTHTIKYGYCTKAISDNAWLAGFIDAEGSFGIRYTKELLLPQKGIQQIKTKKRIACRFRLGQRMTSPVNGESYEAPLSEITAYLGIQLKCRVQTKTGKVYYLIDASSELCRKRLNDYLNSYPLYSSKHLDYQDWYLACIVLDGKQAYSDHGTTLINNLKLRMNTSRTVFNWNHLDTL